MAEEAPLTLEGAIAAFVGVLPPASVTESDRGLDEFISQLKTIADPNRGNPTAFLGRMQTYFGSTVLALYRPDNTHRQLVLGGLAALLRHIHRTELVRLWDIEGPELSQRRLRKYRTMWREEDGVKEEGVLWEGLQKAILASVFTHLERDRPRKAVDKVLKDDPVTLGVGETLFHPLTDIVVGDENWRIAPEVKYEAYTLLSESISKHAQNKVHLRSLLTRYLPQIGTQIEECADRAVMDGIIETAFRLNLDLEKRKEWSIKMFPSSDESSRNHYFQGEFMKLTAPDFYDGSRDLLDEHARDKLTRSQPTNIIYLSHNKTEFTAPDVDNWNFYLCRDSAFVLVEVGPAGSRADRRLVFDFDAIESVDLDRDGDIITATFSNSIPAVFDASILSPAETTNLVVVKFEATGTQAKKWLDTLNNRAERYPDMQPKGNIRPGKVKASEAGEIVSTKHAGSSTNLQAPTTENSVASTSKGKSRLVAQGSKLVEGDPANQSQIKAADVAELAGIRAGGTTSEGSDAEALVGRLEEIVADREEGADVEMEVVERSVNAEMLPGNRLAIEAVERTTTIEIHKSANSSRRTSHRPSVEPTVVTNTISRTLKTPANIPSTTAPTSRKILRPRISHTEANLSPIASQDPAPRSSDDHEVEQSHSNSQDREELVRREQERVSESSALSDVEVSSEEEDELDASYRASREDPIDEDSSSNRPAGRAAKAAAVEKIKGNRRSSTTAPPPAKRQKRGSTAKNVDVDEDEDEEMVEESIPQTLEILPPHPKVITTYKKSSPVRAAVSARWSRGGRASTSRNEDEQEMDEEIEEEDQLLSALPESIDDSSKAKRSRAVATKGNSKKRSRESDETDEAFWNEPGTTVTAPSKAKRQPRASVAAAKKLAAKPAAKSTRGGRKSVENEGTAKKLVGGMKKKGESAVVVEAPKSKRGKAKNAIIRSPTPGIDDTNDNEGINANGDDPVHFSPPPPHATRSTRAADVESPTRTTRFTARAEDDSNQTLEGNLSSNGGKSQPAAAARSTRRSGMRDSGIAETVDARKSVDVVAEPIDEEIVEDDIVEDGRAAEGDGGGDVVMGEEDDQEIPAVEVIAPTRDKGKQRAISPDLPVEPIEEEEATQEEDVEMRDVEEDEPSEILDPDESVRQAWDPQPPRQVRARHDTSSLESPAQQAAGSSRRVVAVPTTRVTTDTEALSQNPHVTRSATNPRASTSRQAIDPPSIVKPHRRLSAARPARSTPLTTRLEIPEIILSTSRRSSKSSDTSHNLPGPSKKAAKKVSAAEKRKKKVPVVVSTDESSQVLPSTLEDDVVVDGDGDDFEAGLHEVVTIIAEKSRQRDELLQRTFNRHYVVNNRKVKSIAAKSTQKTTKLISDLQPMIEKAKTSREYLADLLLELQQNEDEAQVETDRLKGINATLRKKRKSMG